MKQVHLMTDKARARLEKKNKIIERYKKLRYAADETEKLHNLKTSNMQIQIKVAKEYDVTPQWVRIILRDAGVVAKRDRKEVANG